MSCLWIKIAKISERLGLCPQTLALLLARIVSGQLQPANHQNHSELIMKLNRNQWLAWCNHQVRGV